MIRHLRAPAISWFLSALIATPLSFACDFELLPGDEFTFPSRAADLSPYGYSGWAETTTILGASLPYEKYTGRVGKLTAEIVTDPSTKSSYQSAILQNCDRVYVRIPSTAVSHSVIFRRDIASAELLIGRRIWISNSNVTRAQTLYTTDPAVSFALDDGEQIKVIGLEFKEYGHTRGAGPFYLQVEKTTGQKGLLKYNTRYFTFSTPAR